VTEKRKASAKLTTRGRQTKKIPHAEFFENRENYSGAGGEITKRLEKKIERKNPNKPSAISMPKLWRARRNEISDAKNPSRLLRLQDKVRQTLTLP